MPSQPSEPSTHADLTSRSEYETRRIGERLGGLCRPGDLILLEGQLGAGKTALAQGIGRGLGVTTAINSPTFTLIKEYAGRLPFYHIDLYRLDDPDEVADLGLEEYLERGGVCVVEWADRADALWPASWLRIRLLAAGPHERHLYVQGLGARGEALRRDVLSLAPRSVARPAHEEKHVEKAV